MSTWTNYRRFLAFLLMLGASLAWAQSQYQQPDYRLAPGDNIKIQVFQNPDLTLETRVSEQGTITFPLIGTVKIGDMPVASAEQVIAKALRDGGFIKQPNVNIVLTAIRGNSVSVLGQVNKPGRFPLETTNVRLSEVIAVAGGIAPTGADIAIVTGTRDAKPFRHEVDIGDVFLNRRTQDDFVIAPGDVVYVQRAPMYYIYGEVQKPGAYRIERGMTIRQALAQGGGLTVRGTERRLALFRGGAGRPVEVRADLNEPVQPEDVFYIRESLF